MNAEQEFLRRLATDGGKIVSTNMLTETEILHYRAKGRMHVDVDGYGYVLLPLGHELPHGRPA